MCATLQIIELWSKLTWQPERILLMNNEVHVTVNSGSALATAPRAEQRPTSSEVSMNTLALWEASEAPRRNATSSSLSLVQGLPPLAILRHLRAWQLIRCWKTYEKVSKNMKNELFNSFWSDVWGKLELVPTNVKEMLDLGFHFACSNLSQIMILTHLFIEVFFSGLCFFLNFCSGHVVTDTRSADSKVPSILLQGISCGILFGSS